MNEQGQILVLVIAGPTASGKTKLAVALAKAFDGEVISADSMQIYREMTIGTAKPTAEEMEHIPHHLMDFLDPDATFSVAAYVKLAKETIGDIHSRGKLPILAGGTGLYISSLIDNIDFSEIKSDPAIRSRLEQLAQQEGNSILLEMLGKIDPLYAEGMHENNKGRIIRALEVYEITGKTMTWHQEQSRLTPSPYKLCMLGLTFSDRQRLYDRINSRVSVMIEQGLLEETDKLFRSKYSATAYQAIGYKELKPYFDGEKPLEDCLETIRMESRRYAKRQLTWFRRDGRIHWLEVDGYDDFDRLAEVAKTYVQECFFDL